MAAWQLLALDFDRTLTDPPQGLNPRVPAALQRARAAGVRVAVCSGQPLSVLRRWLPDLDGYAAENGCVVATPGGVWRQDWPERPSLLEALTARGVPVRAFEVVLDVARTPEVEELLASLPVEAFGAVASPNVDAINLVPEGHHKGGGLARLRRAFGVPRAACVAVGDGENDVPLLREAGLAVAVANATTEARAAAHLVLSLPDGDGVCALVDAMLAGALAAPGPA